MKTVRGISFIFALLLLSYGCEEDTRCPQAPSVFDLQPLFQVWLHSYEEDTPASSIDVYRPRGYKEFTPSLFRMRYIFNRDGTCEWLVLHPSDAHYMTPGTWGTGAEDERVILIYDPDGTLMEAVSFRIVELRHDLLRVEVGPSVIKGGLSRR